MWWDIAFALLQFVRSVCQRKSCENRSIICEDINKSKVARFYWPTLYISYDGED